MNFIVGHVFDGAVGLKTGANLEDMVAEAIFSPSSGALDNDTIEADSSGRAKLKDLGITGAKIHTDVAGDGLEKDSSGNLQVVVDDLTMEIVSGELVVKDATGKIVLDASLETFDDGGVTTLRLADDAVTTDKILDDAVTGAKVADDSINFGHWDIAVLTEVETPPISLAEGALHIVYEEL